MSQKDSYEFEGKEVEQVWEGAEGSFWVITRNHDESPHFFGYVRLASMPQLAEWGSIDGSIIKNDWVSKVPRENWNVAGPDEIDIEKVE